MSLMSETPGTYKDERRVLQGKLLGRQHVQGHTSVRHTLTVNRETCFKGKPHQVASHWRWGVGPNPMAAVSVDVRKSLIFRGMQS